jgi:hypothetical protein
MTALLVFLGVTAVIEAAITGVIANGKGRLVAEGVMLGFFLGLIGMVIELCLPRPGQRASGRADKLAWQDKARRPLSYGQHPFGDSESARMLADLKRDREGI